jgi:hypothetical protein
MNLTLQRLTPPGRPRTFGKLFIDGVQVCHTLEDEVREQLGQPVADWKIKGATAIPSTQFVRTSYEVTLEQSARFGPDTLSVNNVPGFSFIRMHAGNTEQDTEGCPLLGMQINSLGIVGGTSRPAVALVKGRVAEAINKGEKVWLTINNAVEAA